MPEFSKLQEEYLVKAIRVLQWRASQYCACDDPDYDPGEHSPEDAFSHGEIYGAINEARIICDLARIPYEVSIPPN